MDRTSWIGVLACLALLFGWTWWNTKEAAKLAAQRAAEAAKAPKMEPAKAGEAKPADPASTPVVTAPAPGTPAVETAVLENDFIRLHLTNQGAGIRRAEMKKHPRHLGEAELIAINETASHPVASLSPGPKQYDTSVWSVVAKTKTEITYETSAADGVKWRKTIRLPGAENDPYEVSVLLEAQNNGQAPFEMGSRYLYTGSAAPLHLNEWSMQIGSYWMAKDGDFEYKTVDHFGGRKVLGIFGGSEKPHDQFVLKQLHWAGVNDQFFTTIVRPSEPYEGGVWIGRFPVTVEGNEAESRKKRMFASEAALTLPKETIAPGATAKAEYGIYLGPKEYARLKALGDRRQRVMHYDEIPIFGWLFGWAIKPIASALIVGLVMIKGWVGDYGVAIILITLLIRLLIWPVYAKSARSMKRMSKLTPLMKDLREKYADNPQKMNEETMKLYQTYGINPLGGCLPMFIQLPVFLAFYRMLWSAVELRHESFLWVKDLAMPDTLFTIPVMGGIDVNPLPILMGVTSFIQIAITPKTGDKTQQMIFMLMPFMFLFICYNFASALALYWTVSNTFSIFQTWIMNKLPEPELVKRTGPVKKGFMQRMAEQADAAKKAKESGGALPSGPGSRTKMPGEKGDRHTKKKRR